MAHLKTSSRLSAGLALGLVGVALAGCSRTGGTSNSTVTATTSASEPALTVYLSDPPAVQSNPSLQDAVDAEQLAWNQLESKLISKRADLKLVSVTGSVSDNARKAIGSGGLIAYLGEVQPGQSVQTVGITNTLDVLELSPTDTVRPSKENFEDQSTYGRTFASLPLDLGTSPAALTQALGSSFTSSFQTAYGHRPAAAAAQGYDAVYVLLRVLAFLGDQANVRTKIVTDTIATLRANRGQASVPAFTIKK